RLPRPRGRVPSPRRRRSPRARAGAMTLDDESVTKEEHVPPHETTASPVEVSLAMPRYFGVTPPTLLFGIATATLALAVMFAVFAHWIAALVLAAAVLVEIALFLGIARRKPDTLVAK